MLIWLTNSYRCPRSDIRSAPGPLDTLLRDQGPTRGGWGRARNPGPRVTCHGRNPGRLVWIVRRVAGRATAGVQETEGGHDSPEPLENKREEGPRVALHQQCRSGLCQVEGVRASGAGMVLLVDRVRNGGPDRRTAPGRAAGGRRLGSRSFLRAGDGRDAARGFGSCHAIRASPWGLARACHPGPQGTIDYRFSKKGLTWPLIPQ